MNKNPKVQRAGNEASNAVLDVMGLVPEDLANQVGCISEFLGWLDDLFYLIDQARKEGTPTGDLRAVRLLGMGRYLVQDYQGFCDSIQEDMQQAMRSAGIIATGSVVK